MQVVESVISLSKDLKKEFLNFTREKQPTSRFCDLLKKVEKMDGEEAVDILTGIMVQVNNEKNTFYLDSILSQMGSFIKRWMFYVLEEVNRALALYFEYGDIKKIFFLLDLIGHKADARTLEILQKFSVSYKDQKIVSKLIGIRGSIEKKINAGLRNIESLELASIITAYDMWYE